MSDSRLGRQYFLPTGLGQLIHRLQVNDNSLGERERGGEGHAHWASKGTSRFFPYKYIGYWMRTSPRIVTAVFIFHLRGWGHHPLGAQTHLG